MNCEQVRDHTAPEIHDRAGRQYHQFIGMLANSERSTRRAAPILRSFFGDLPPRPARFIDGFPSPGRLLATPISRLITAGKKTFASAGPRVL